MFEQNLDQGMMKETRIYPFTDTEPQAAQGHVTVYKWHTEPSVVNINVHLSTSISREQWEKLQPAVNRAFEIAAQFDEGA